jgi:hypothetical protein
MLFFDIMNLMKFNRSYRLTIQVSETEQVVIEPPLTINFSVNRSTQSSTNVLKLSIMNLSDRTRNKIFQDRYDFRFQKQVTFEAGYSELSLVFQGSLFEAYSERVNTEIITRITSWDGGYDIYNAISNKTLASNLTKGEIMKSLAKDFTYVTEGVIAESDNPENPFRRPVVLEGNTYSLIKLYGEGAVYIDFQKLYKLEDNQFIKAFVPVFDSNNGLLATPKRRSSLVSISTVFEPRIILSQVIEIKSDVSSAFDGQFKVIGLSHTGTISEAVGGNCSSSFDLLVAANLKAV